VNRVLATVVLGVCVSACGGSSSSPSTPTPASTPSTRVIGLSGNLAFGNVVIGQEASLTLTITNTGNSTLTVTRMTASTGSDIYSISWASGTISPGGSQRVTVFAAPTAAITYNGTLTVNGDQTSGANTISISATGTTSTPAPTPTPPSIFFVNGTVTDGTSHGILPNITVQIVSGTNVGKSAVTDSTGNYLMSGLSAGTFTLSVAAVSYQTTTQQVTLSANTRVDLALQRVTPPVVTPPVVTPPISPIPSSCTAGPYTWDANPNVLRCRNRLGQFAPSACCGR